MNKLDQNLYKIADECGVIPEYSVIWAFTLRGKHIIKQYIKKTIHRLEGRYQRIILVGSEEDLLAIKRICKKLFDKCASRILFMSIIDSSKGFDVWYKDEPDSIVDEIKKQAGVVLLVSKRYGKTAEMLLLGNGIDVVDLYDEMRYEGINACDVVFTYPVVKRVIKHFLYSIDKLVKNGWIAGVRERRLKLSDPRYLVENYEAIYVYKSQAEKCQSLKKRKFYLENVIWSSFQIRDFGMMNTYIDIYAGEFDDKYTLFKNRISSYICKVNDMVKTRSERDIIVQWIDAVPYVDSVSWKLMDSVRKKSFEFEYVYSGVPQTRAIAKIIATGEDYFEGCLYEKDVSKVAETKLGRMLNKYGYEFNSLGSAMHAFQIDECILEYNFYDVYRTPAPFVMWLAKARLVEADKKQFILIHNVLETHTPYYAGRMDEIWCPTNDDNISTDVKYNKIRESRYQYLEKVLNEFQNCVNERQTVTVYMSDHGRQTEKNYQWEDSRCRAFCFLYGGGIMPGKSSGMFSFEKMSDCVEKIIKNDNNWDELTNTYAFVKAEDYYSRHYCENLYQKYLKGEYHQNSFMSHMQFRAVCTAEDKLIRYPIKDIYVKLPDDKIVDIEEADEDRIAYLRELCGNSFINVFHNEKYLYCIDVYEKIGLIKDDNWVII